MHLACADGHIEVVRLLLAAHANPDAKDRWGNTPRSEARNAVQAGRAGPELLTALGLDAPTRQPLPPF